MVGRLIETPDCVAEGTQELLRIDPRFQAAIDVTGELPLRRKPDGFPALLNAITSQQISVAAATSIWDRLESAGLTTVANVLRAEDDDLRACGLSRPKVRYAKALAAADIDYGALHDLPDETVISTLTEVPGIGQWTAEIYAMFSLGRADVFAPGDLALQEAAKLLFGLDERPREKAFRAMATAWSPWRAVAARALWAYYRERKNREGIG